MRTTLLIKPGEIAVGNTTSPLPSSDQILIRPSRAGICGSDLSLFLGHRTVPYPHILGHELVGTVEAVGQEVEGFRPGMRVLVEPNFPCGHCRFCRTGRGSICPNKLSMGVNLPGCFAELVAAPARFVWAVPDAVSDEDAATIEPLAVAVHALKQSGAKPGDTVAIVGCGAIGQLLILAAAAQGVRVLAHDCSPLQLERAQALGAQPLDNKNTATIWDRENVTLVFECAGAAAAVELALEAAPRGSRVLLLGLSTRPASFTPLRLVREGIAIEPSLIYDHPADFRSTLDLVAEGRLRPSRIVSSTLPLECVAEAFSRATQGIENKVHLLIG